MCLPFILSPTELLENKVNIQYHFVTGAGTKEIGMSNKICGMIEVTAVCQLFRWEHDHGIN